MNTLNEEKASDERTLVHCDRVTLGLLLYLIKIQSLDVVANTYEAADEEHTNKANCTFSLNGGIFVADWSQLRKNVGLSIWFICTPPRVDCG
jgi:hypothetical protein